MLDLQHNEVKIVTDIFKSIFKNDLEVYAFGSRTKNTARKYSDLDLLIKSDEPLAYSLLCEIDHKFSESDLPYKTDIIDWHTISDDFKLHITPQLLRIL